MKCSGGAIAKRSGEFDGLLRPERTCRGDRERIWLDDAESITEDTETADDAEVTDTVERAEDIEVAERAEVEEAMMANAQAQAITGGKES